MDEKRQEFFVNDGVIKKVEKILKVICNRETISYAFWGATTTIVNLGIYMLLCGIMDYKIANVIAIIICKIYSYLVNKFFVFHSKNDNFVELVKEIIRYVFSRGLIGIIDFAGVILLVECLQINEKGAKIIITILVIILNYVLSKKTVFHTKESKE